MSYAEKKFPEAEKIFRKLLEKYPNDQRLNFATAEVLMNTGRGKQALGAIAGTGQEGAQQSGGGLRRGLYGAAQSKICQPPTASTASLFRRSPRTSSCICAWARTLRQEGQVQQAIEMLRRGQALAPTNAMANLQLGLTYESAGMRREAVPFYENVLKANGNNAVALNNLAFLLAEDGRDLDAR